VGSTDGQRIGIELVVSLGLFTPVSGVEKKLLRHISMHDLVRDKSICQSTWSSYGLPQLWYCCINMFIPWFRID
jgi:hypothetical protein